MTSLSVGDFKSVLSLLLRQLPDGTRVFVHHIDDRQLEPFILPPDEDSGLDILYVNCVFVLTEQGWIFATNLNKAPRSSIVGLYSAPGAKISTLDPRLKFILNHYFQQRQNLYCYSVGDSSPHDTDGMVWAVLSFFSTCIFR